MNRRRRYGASIQREAGKWADHLAIETSGGTDAWLDHPTILGHYRALGLIDELQWERWVARELDGPAERSLDLGCGTGGGSLRVWEAGGTRCLEGIDVSEPRVAEAERRRKEAGAPGRFWVEDANQVELPPNSYDLIFSVQSFHHFLNLEHVYAQVAQALTPRGLFVLEEFVGPSQFQWTDEQLAITRGLLALIPESLRVFRDGSLKAAEGRPAPSMVENVSPFEAIRSEQIPFYFEEHFAVMEKRLLGGTIQHLLYNGIVRNFDVSDQEATRIMESIWRVEDALIASNLLPSDFMLLIGRRR